MLDLLVHLVTISHRLELWRIDPLLHGELTLKLCCLYEAKAESVDLPCASEPLPEATFLRYNRSHLLECKEECARALDFIKKARQNAPLGDGPKRMLRTMDHTAERKGKPEEVMAGDKGEEKGLGGRVRQSGLVLEDLHAELVYVLTRICVKLATTIPPPLSNYCNYYSYCTLQREEITIRVCCS